MKDEWSKKEQCICGLVIGLYLTSPIWIYLIALGIFHMLIGG